MNSHSLLINYAGLPYALEGMIPDNGLAAIAATLIDNGHSTKILDFFNFEQYKKDFPRQLAPDILRVYMSIDASTQRKQYPDERDIAAIKELDRAAETHLRKRLESVVQDITSEVEREKPDFAGFKLFMGPGFRHSVTIAEKLKQRFPDLPLIAGGPQVDAFREMIFGFTEVFDVLCFGEGEVSIVPLADALKNGRSLKGIPNVAYKQGSEIVINPVSRISDLSTLPLYNFDHGTYPSMKDKVLYYYIEASRGCDNSCFFCCHKNKNGSRREMSAEEFVDRIVAMRGRYGFSVFREAGSNTSGMTRTAIAREIINRQLSFRHSAFAYVSDIEEEGIRTFKDSGGISLLFGIEALEQGILSRTMGKKTTVEEIEKAFAYCKKHGVKDVASLIYPCPGASDKQMADSLKKLVELRPYAMSSYLPFLLQKTPWAANPSRFGFEPTGDVASSMRDYLPKLCIPPILWDPLPYRINGRSFEGPDGYAMQANNFVVDTASAGILVQTVDSMIVLADLLGMDAADYRKQELGLFAAGNFDAVQGMMQEMNRRVKDGC